MKKITFLALLLSLTTIIFAQAPIAGFTFNSTTCLGNSSDFFDTSSNAPTSWIWQYGDGATDTTNALSVSHTYSAIGSYMVTLIVINSFGSDTMINTVNVFDVTSSDNVSNATCFSMCDGSINLIR